MAITAYRYSRPSALFLSGLWFVTSYYELEKVLRQWLPERLQKRVARLWSLASCASAREVRLRREVDMSAVAAKARVAMPSSKSVTASLVELQMQGVRVIGPNEGPESLNDMPP